MFKKILLAWVLMLNILVIVPAYADPAPGSAPAQESDPTHALQSEYFMFDLRAITHPDVKEEKYVRNGINYLFQRAVTVMAATIGGAAVLMITVGGFMILASAGQHKWVEVGQEMIFKSLIGLVFAFGAYIMVQAVELLIKSIYGS